MKKRKSEQLSSRLRLPGFGLLFLLLASAAYGEYTVTYAEGFPQVKSSAGWEELFIGDTVPEEGMVKLGPRDYLELDTPRGVLRFDSPGSYRLEKVASRAGAADTRADVIAMIGGKLNSAVKGADYRVPSAGGGVRGSEAGGEEDLFFMESEALDLIRRGKELLTGELDRERLSTAQRYFQEAKLYAADPTEEYEAQFYLGYVAQRRGEPQQAMEYLVDADPAPEAPYYGSYLLLSGRVYLMNERPAEAVRLLENAKMQFLSDEERENVHLLLGIALIETGRPQAAVAPLEAVLRGSGDSAVESAAQQLLQGLDR
jgi:tetratricopeptide (TPR) repeat protein